jgi:tetratricopeptide (TPR) repeat protein
MRFSLAAIPARWTALALSVLVALLLAYFSIRNARAEHFIAQETPRGFGHAVRLEPENPRLWYLLGRYWQYNFDQQNLTRAVSSYRHAISLDPRSASTWLDLAQAYEDQGRDEDAQNAYRGARNAYPVSPEVAWRQANFLLRQGKNAAAYVEFRRAIEGQPSLALAAISRCWRADPDVDGILGQVLPPRSETYLAAMKFFVDEGNSDAAIAAWQRVLASASGVPLKESFSLLDLLINAGRTKEALAVWEQARTLAGVQEPPEASHSLVWDGGFETDALGGGFAWRLRQHPGIQIDFDAQNKHSGARALRIRFDGKENFDFSNVSQYVAVEPRMTYHLTGWIRTDDISTDNGMRLLVYDPKDPGKSGRLTSEVVGTEPWTQLELTFTTGPETHLVVLCIRRIPTTKLDNKLRGTAWVDDVTLAPLRSAGKIR